ncbi:MAG: ribosome small subunit-dependent GTPase A [bacterium]|nr:ribosome small subunit-dependent GTPase A [bacterium]
MINPPPQTVARVATVARRTCLLRLLSGEVVEAALRGKLFDADTDGITVGDFVRAELEAGQWAVDEVLPRANAYLRKGLRKEKQVMFANADRVIIVASLARPQTKIAAIDRFLVAALFGGVPPLLVLTKSDLDDSNARAKEITDLYDSFDMPIAVVSNESGDGIESLRAQLTTGVTAIIGNSGVGKSSLANALVPNLELRVQEVSSWSGKGVHTTTAALLIPLSDTALAIDTPGMKSFVPYGLTKHNIAALFPDIAELAHACRFRNCAHQSEPDCAVLNALDEETLAPSRYRSFQRLLSEVESEF